MVEPNSQASDIVRELQEANRWLRLLAEPHIVDRLSQQLTGKLDRAIYQASTGGSSREVAKEAGVAHTTVQDAWERWAPSGIVEETETPGRFRRIVDLRPFEHQLAKHG